MKEAVQIFLFSIHSPWNFPLFEFPEFKQQKFLMVCGFFSGSLCCWVHQWYLIALLLVLRPSMSKDIERNEGRQSKSLTGWEKDRQEERNELFISCVNPDSMWLHTCWLLHRLSLVYFGEGWVFERLCLPLRSNLRSGPASQHLIIWHNMLILNTALTVSY